MTDDSNKSFRERVEEIREEHRPDGAEKSNKPNQNELSTENLDPSDPSESLDYHLREIRQDAQDVTESDPFHIQADKETRVAAIGALFLVVTVGAALLYPPDMALMGGLSWGVIASGVGFLYLTRSGVAIRRSFQDSIGNGQQQQQQVGGKSEEPKRICGECGWQNPQENKYCHDCGAELGV